MSSNENLTWDLWKVCSGVLVTNNWKYKAVAMQLR